MEKQFIPYEQALELKKLGFDEECFGYYNMINHSGKFKFDIRIWENSDDYIEAPLWQQAFDFFREKCGLTSWVYQSRKEGYYYSILKQEMFVSGYTTPFKVYEKARLECLKKLILLVKNN